MKSFGTIGSFVFAALLSMVFTPAIASDIKMVDFSIDSSKVIACPYKPHHPLTLNIRNGKFAFTYKDDQFYVLVLDICGKILYKKQSYNAAECKLSNDCSLLYVNHFIGEERWSSDVHDIKTGKIYYPFGEGNSFRPLSSGKYYYKGRHPTVIRDLNGVEVGNIYKTNGCKDIKEIDDSLLLSVDGNFLSLYELPEFKLLYAREFYLFHNFSFNRYRIKSGFSLDGRYCTIFGEGHAEVYDISDDKFCELPDFPRSGIRQYSLLFIKSQGNKIFYLSHNRGSNRPTCFIWDKIDSGYVNTIKWFDLPFDKNVKSINGCIEYSNALFIYANWYECDGEYQGLLVKFPNDAGGDIIMAKSGGILVPYGNNKFASFMFQYPDIHSLKVEYLSLPQD